MLRWMRDDPARALHYVAGAFWSSVAVDGRKENAPLAEILAELAEAPLEQLTSTRGPREWARRHRDGRAAPKTTRRGRAVVVEGLPSLPRLPRSKAEAARALVACVAKHKHRPAPVLASLAYLQIMQAPVTVGWGSPWSTDPAEVEGRMVEQLQRTEQRSDRTAETMAIALLVGWGLTRKAASDALQRV